MDDYKFEHLLASCRKQDPKKKGVGVEQLSLEKFQFQIKDDGISDLTDMVKLYDWLTARLRLTAHTIYHLSIYHPDSPKFWLKNIHESDENKNFSVGLDLERFIESKKAKEQSKTNKPFYIPDNYELARKVLKDFLSLAENKKYSIEDNSFRECANFESKDKKAILALADYIQKKYVEPSVKEILEEFKIKKCIFKDNTIDFEL